MIPRGIAKTDWERAKSEAREAMIVAVRSPAMRMSYQDLTKRISAVQFHFKSLELDQLLSEISTEENAAGRGMLSVVVVRHDGDGLPGDGFFALAKTLGKKVKSKTDFWIAEVKFVRHAHVSLGR